VEPNFSPNRSTESSDSFGVGSLSIALIGPNERQRWALANAISKCQGMNVREFSSYPTSIEDAPRLLEQVFDVIIIDLDGDTEFALDLVDSISVNDAATVMVYSAKSDPNLVVRCMRAGAREYLTAPYDEDTIAEALVRAAAARRPDAQSPQKKSGRLLVYLGAKGGSGVTTIACSFSIALAQDASESTLLIDLALPMGDAALNLGIAAEYSTDDALGNAEQLDVSTLRGLVVKHHSGISVLAAPSKVPEVDASRDTIDKLISVARQAFDNVVVDVGSRLDLMDTSLFKEATTIFLVTQAGISELRNSNRVISRFFSGVGPNLEVVINRFQSGSPGVTEDVIDKAIERPVRWKLPDDYAATREIQNTASALASSNSAISRMIMEMASSVTGRPVPEEKKKALSFRSQKTQTEKTTMDEKLPGLLDAAPATAGPQPPVRWPRPDPIVYGTALGEDQFNATALVSGTFVYTPSAGYVLTAGAHSIWVTFTPAQSSDGAVVQTEVAIQVLKATPSITWREPAVTLTGCELGDTELNASASIPGTFVYSPAAGEILSEGRHTLTVTFAPNDDRNYTVAEAAVEITVVSATPEIMWPTPTAISYGVRLSGTQLNAKVNAPGTMSYNPGPGALLAAGEHTLSVTYTPEASTRYLPASSAVLLTVAKTTPSVTWPSPDRIRHGTALNRVQLNATASVPGTFTYTPRRGEVLPPGRHTLSAIFTPADTFNHTVVEATVTLEVSEISPTTITWHNPAPIAYGAQLSGDQLNAAASVPGTFVYSPAAGCVLAPGTYTLAVSFTPEDTEWFEEAQATVTLLVERTPGVDSQGSTSTKVSSTSTPAPGYFAETDVEREPKQGGASHPTPGFERERRHYKGAIYERGEDGQWYRVSE
jgi:pilus assembly protein CpaE